MIGIHVATPSHIVLDNEQGLLWSNEMIVDLPVLVQHTQSWPTNLVHDAGSLMVVPLQAAGKIADPPVVDDCIPAPHPMVALCLTRVVGSPHRSGA